MKVIAIVAHDEKMGIGKDGKLPWYEPDDLKRFAKLTKGHAVLMGRKTWESLPKKPLPSRTNIVCSRYAEFLELPKNVLKYEDAKEAIDDIKKNPISDILWIIGGAEIYKTTLEFCDELYVTKIPRVHDCDVFFPDYAKDFTLIYEEMCIYKIYKRKNFIYSSNYGRKEIFSFGESGEDFGNSNREH